MLYLVPVPIGNLEDISYRAVRLLSEADIILAEDTRVTAKLLNHYGIKNTMRSFHAHNEHGKLSAVMHELEAGKNIILVSDAGTPGISDPGFLLVREAIEKQIELTCLPGATAFVPALVMSGLPCDRFYFEGFLPHKKGRMTRINALLEMPCTVVMYESPHRIGKLLQQLSEAGAGQRRICISREISKVYEENIRGTVQEVLKQLEERNQSKGEIVVCLEASAS